MGYQKYSNAYNGKNNYRGGGSENSTGGAYYSPSYIKSPYDLGVDMRRGIGGGNTSGGGYTGGGMKDDLIKKQISFLEKKIKTYKNQKYFVKGNEEYRLEKLESFQKQIANLERQLKVSKPISELSEFTDRLEQEQKMMPKPVINQNSVVGLTDYASQSTPTLLRDRPESLGQVLDDQGIPINRPRTEQLQEYKGRIASQELAQNINESELLNQERVNVSPDTPAQAYQNIDDYLNNLQRQSEDRMSEDSLNSDVLEMKFDASMSRPESIPDDLSQNSRSNSSMFGDYSSYPQESQLQQADINALTDVVETGFDKLAQRIVDLNNTNKAFTTADEARLINGLTSAAQKIIRDPKTLLMPIDKQLLFGIQGLPVSIKNDPRTLQALQDVIKMTSGYRGEVKPLFKTINRVKLQADPELIKSRVNPAYYGNKYITQRAPTRLSQPSDYMNMLRVYKYRTA